jgi:hypothetical protein
MATMSRSIIAMIDNDAGGGWITEKDDSGEK